MGKTALKQVIQYGFQKDKLQDLEIYCIIYDHLFLYVSEQHHTLVQYDFNFLLR
jgi:hypothetical protein